MHWADDATLCDAPGACSLMDIALKAGVDPDHAADVAGAIGTYCRARHGSEELDCDYLLFLFSRSGFREGSLDHMVHNIALFRALVHAPDAAALYEAYRRRLVWAGPADVSVGGKAVYVDLRKVKVGEREDVLLVWTRVFTKLADWVCAWRAGSSELKAVHVEGRLGRACEWESARVQLEGTLHSRETTRHLPAAALYWSM